MSDEHLPYWIQHADFSSTDTDPVPLASALDVLRNHDWQRECDAQTALNAEGEEQCPPGIGFHHGMDQPLHLLHLCPKGVNSWLVHYVYQETVRRFWFWTGEVNRKKTAVNLSNRNAEDAVTYFFENRHFDVMSTLERGK